MRRWLSVLAAVSIVASFAASTVRAPAPAGSRTAVSVPKALGNAPLAFEPNVGQAPSHVRFLAHAGSATVLFGQDAVALSLRQGNASQSPAVSATRSRSMSFDQVAMTFVAANATATVVASDPLAGRSNYLFGSDPAAWRTNIAQYGRITYRELYPGIDLTFYGNQGGRLEYDFALRPGADLSRIHLTFEGADGLHVDSSGNLVIGLTRSSLVQPRPRIYQVVGGTRRMIPGHYVLAGNQLHFAVGAFDRTKQLVIDPEIAYSTYLGGSADEFAEEQPAVDSSGHLYVCGITDSPDFPVTDGAFQQSIGGGWDGFTTELTPDGSGVVYSTYLGTSDFDDVVACDVDANGNLYIVGATNSADFPVTDGAFQRSLAGGFDGFITKLSPDGSRLLYSTYIGGSGDEFITVDHIAVDSAGNVVAAADTNSTDFPTTAGAYQTANAGCEGSCSKNPANDVVVVKLNASGSALMYSTYLGGPGFDAYPNLAVDAAGDAYVAGFTGSLHFPTTPGAFQPHLKGGTVLGDAFVAKLDPTGSSLIYATYLGGGGSDGPGGVAIDAAGDAYVGGVTCSRDFPVTPGAFQTKNAGGTGGCRAFPGPFDGFVTEFNPHGTGLVFSTYLGGSGYDVLGLAGLDSSGRVIVVGATTSLDFPVTHDAFQPTNHGGPGDGIIAELTSDGSGLSFSTYWGGSGFELPHGAVVDASDNLYFAGCTSSTDFPVTRGAFQTTFQGGNSDEFLCFPEPDDAFVTKIAFADR